MLHVRFARGRDTVRFSTANRVKEHRKRLTVTVTVKQPQLLAKAKKLVDLMTVGTRQRLVTYLHGPEGMSSAVSTADNCATTWPNDSTVRLFAGSKSSATPMLTT